MATLQKLKGNKFQSAQYEVPLTSIFPAVTPTRNTGPQPRTKSFLGDLSSSSDEDAIPNEATEPETSASEDEDSDHSETEAVEPRYPVRERNPPAWLRSEDWTT